VKFGDLDLNTDAGRRELLDRLSKAAGRVCAEYATPEWALGYYQVYSSCFQSTLAAAVEKIHHEKVSALFAATSRLPTR
jgi:UrcA family protein